MKDAASTAQREQNQRQGLIVGTLTLPFRLLGVLIGSLLFSIVVECVGMHLFWRQPWSFQNKCMPTHSTTMENSSEPISTPSSRNGKVIVPTIKP